MSTVLKVFGVAVAIPPLSRNAVTFRKSATIVSPERFAGREFVFSSTLDSLEVARQIRAVLSTRKPGVDVPLTDAEVLHLRWRRCGKYDRARNDIVGDPTPVRMTDGRAAPGA